MDEAIAQLGEHMEELKSSLMFPTVVWGDENFGITNYFFWTIVVIAILLIVILVTARKLSFIPKKNFAHIAEYLYDVASRNITKGAIGNGYKKHVPFLATLFFFILIANFVGLIPGANAATGSISVTWSLAIISFVYFNYCGVKAKGGLKYLKEICPPGLPKPLVPVIWFFESLSLCLRAFTLSVRLFGNMFAGHMVLGIFAILASVFTTSAIQTAQYALSLTSIGWMLFLICMYLLECLVAFLQAYVFTILSAVYISQATSEEH